MFKDYLFIFNIKEKMDNNDLGLIKYNFSIFKEFYDKDLEINEILIKKASELTENYNCFMSNYDAKSLWEKKKLMAMKKTKTPYNHHRTKPRVILIDFSDDMKCKKEFTSFLNKLTDVNKEIIYSKIKSFLEDINDLKIKNMLFDVLINFIKASSNNIYIDVLFLFDNEFINININKYLEKFINNKLWIIDEIKIENKILYNNENYDKYCFYVKFKKNSLSIIKALLIILNRLDKMDTIKRLLQEIINDLNEYINTSNYKHIIELLLDEITLFFEYYKDDEFLNNLKKLDLDLFEYSTKFKIMQIIDN
jgi:hypothetical protein